MAVITAPDEVANLRRSGRIAAQALQAVVAAVKPGISTAALNAIAEERIVALGGRPSFKGFEGFPSGLCTSINDEVVHGMPSVARLLKDGDLIGLDIGVDYQGLFSDHAVTVAVGSVPERIRALIDDTRRSLMAGIAAARPNARVGDIGAAVADALRPGGYGIVTQLTGHGLGYAVHEPPTIANVGKPGTGPLLVPGMVLAIEPMVNLGGPEVTTAADGWTVVTVDHAPAAHFEHTIIITDGAPEIITVP